MLASVAAIYRYPVKGLSAESLQSVDLAPGGRIANDRRFGLALGSTPVAGARAAWMPKTSFLMLVRNERLAALGTAFDDRTECLTIRRNGKPVATGQLTSSVGRAVIEDFFAAFLGDETRGRPRVVEVEPGQAFTDSPDAFLSLINLASVRDLGRVTGCDVDRLRFRANIYVHGLAPWVEFDWIGRDIAVGGVRMRVEERIGRCAATTVNPATAERDLNVPQALQRGFGHTDLGVFAAVWSGGTLALGDAVATIDA
ncbi:MAG: MOSC domain-containing protein [Rhodospirillales bacterium]|nr:MOSC domain-containing protein [Rhodospirillales bacterium]